MTTVLFIGARAWSRGSDRAACIMNIRKVQISVPSYQNLDDFALGTMPRVEGGTPSIVDHLHPKGYVDESIHEMLKSNANCPGGGSYEFPCEDYFPDFRELYLTCSLESREKQLLPDDRDG